MKVATVWVENEQKTCELNTLDDGKCQFIRKLWMSYESDNGTRQRNEWPTYELSTSHITHIMKSNIIRH